jgi:cellulose synthase/poly-beta-1,6-N-acetylglucosamine synthase-like glycosyltransferase
VQLQTYGVDQIVISDASTDASAEIIRKHCAEDSRLIPVFSENRRQLSTILAGLHVAKGDIVFFLDGDDCYQENHIERMMHWWERYPHADVMYCRHKPYRLRTCALDESHFHLAQCQNSE